MKILNKIINKINHHKFPLLVFIILSFVPFIWLYNKNGTFFAFGDQGLYLAFYSPEYILKLSRYLISSNNIGMSSSLSFVFYPFALIFSFILSIVGHNYQYAQIILYNLIIFISILFFYLFILELFEYNNDKKIIAFVSAIFYVFNFFTIYYLLGAVIYMFPFMSIILYCLIKILKHKNLFYFYSLILSLIISLFVINAGFFSVYFCISWIILFFIFYLILQNNNLNWKKEINYLSKMLFMIFLINSWWVFPFLNQMFNRYSFSKNIIISFSQLYKGFAGSINLLTILRNAQVKNSLWYFHLEYEKTYQDTLFILLGFFITFIILVPVIKYPKKFFSFVLLYLIGIYFYLAYNHPFGNLKLWFLEHLPYHYVYIDNYNFIMIVIISASILFGSGSVMIYKFIEKNIGKKTSIATLFFIMFISCVVYVYPAWSNKIFNGYTNFNNRKVTMLAKVPHYYSRAKNLFNRTDINYNIFILPNVYSNVNLNWHFGYDDGGLYFYLLYKHSEFSVNMNYSNNLFYDLQDYNYQNLRSFLAMTSTKYVILQNDVLQSKSNKIGFFNYSKYLKYISKPELRSILNTSNGLKLVRKFGKLDIYKLSDKYFIPRIWMPKKLIFVNNELKLHDLDNYMVPITMQNSFKVRTAVFAKLFSQNRHSERIKNYELNNIADKYSKQYSLTNKILDIPASDKTLKISETVKKITAPTIEFKEINPSKYAVIVHNAKTSFPLIFNLMYLKGWDVYPQIYPKRAGVDYSRDNFNKTYNLLKQTNADKNIAFLGNKFISKDINGTIQNDNIPDGHILQTLFEKPLPAKYHFVANGYSNSWWINLDYIKKLGPRYYKVNKNGTVDFELIIDYWPQRLLYIGLIISGSSLFIIIAYLIYDATRKRKNKKDTNNNDAADTNNINNIKK